jgi:hypothetical protein
MPRITVGTENDAPIEIHYEDHGSAESRTRSLYREGSSLACAFA